MSSLSLTRAFTNRRAKNGLDTVNNARSKNSSESSSSLRRKISAPVQLIHTTNMLSYNAPDITQRPETFTSSGSSMRSSQSTDDEIDGSATIASTPPTSPDLASGDEDCSSPEVNRLSSYFVAPSLALSDSPATTPAKTFPEVKSAPLDAKLIRLRASQQSTTSSSSSSRSTSLEQLPFSSKSNGPPAIPRRAPSHTKKASYEALARSYSTSHSSRTSKDTMSSKSSLVNSRSSSLALSRSASMATRQSSKSPTPLSMQSTPVAHSLSEHEAPSIAADPPHPFGQELAQVTEIAEEYGIRGAMAAADEEEKELAARGLCKLAAEVYLSEVDRLVNRFFSEAKVPSQIAVGWI